MRDPQVIYIVNESTTVNGKTTIAVVNVGETDEEITIEFPNPLHNASLYTYEENNMRTDANGFPTHTRQGITGTDYQTKLKAQTFILITEIRY